MRQIGSAALDAERKSVMTLQTMLLRTTADMAGPTAGFVPAENEPIPDFRPQKLLLERPTIDRDAGGRRPA